MKQSIFGLAALTGAATLLTGCINNDYDLSNVDTTSEIKINNLTIPVNFETITLGEIFDIDEDSKIQPVTINGREFYAVTQHGEIDSKSINIPAFSTTAPTVPETNAKFDLQLQTPATGNRAALPATFDYLYNLEDFTPQQVKIVATGIDNAVREIHVLECQPMNFKVTFRETQLPSYVTLSFDRLELEIMKGLIFESLPSNYSYNASTGVLSITNVACPDKTFTLSLTATGIDFTKTSTTVQNGTFNYQGQVKLISGVLRATVDLTAAVQNFTPNAQVNFNVKTTIDPLTATYFSGVVQYDITGNGLDISPVTLNDLPDFLNQEGTDLKLANPQIYLNINNPVAIFGLYFQTGLELSAIRGSQTTPYTPDNGKLIKTEPNNSGPYNFLLSPENVTEPLSYYANDLQHIPFTGLSQILSGNGLPDEIGIKLLNPQLPLQSVTRFKLGNPVPGIVGSYDFIAPLALKTGSQIIYGDTKDGWGDDDIDKLKITALSIEADVTSSLPLDATLEAYPIGRDGHRIPGIKAHGTIPANCVDKHMVISMEGGTIEHLDGVTFTATVTPASEESLAPNQTITLKNFRATIGAAYTTEF